MSVLWCWLFGHRYMRAGGLTLWCCRRCGDEVCHFCNFEVAAGESATPKGDAES